MLNKYMSLLHSKVWVQNTHRYPISINVKQLREILDPNEPMHKDCFNMGVRMLACDEGVFLKEPTPFFMDLRFSVRYKAIHGPPI